MNRIQTFTPIRVDEVRWLLGRVYGSCLDGEFAAVEMKTVLFEMTLNNIMRMIAGKRYYGDKMADLEVTLLCFCCLISFLAIGYCSTGRAR